MAQIGAIFYVAWGLLHLFAAFQVYKLGSRQMAGMVQGRIYQSVWTLASIGRAPTPGISGIQPIRDHNLKGEQQ